MLHAYFDESGTQKNSPVLCIAGYVAEPDQWKKLCAAWKQMLQQEEKGLSVFHMVDLKNWSGEVRKHLQREECDVLIARAVELIREHVRFGLSVTISADEYTQGASQPFRSKHGTASTFCAQVVVTYVAQYAKENQCEPVSYFFESGDRGQNHLEKIFLAIKNDRKWKRDFALDHYAFIPKRDAAGLQTADALAYLTSTSWDKPEPQELTSLKQVDHWFRHLTSQEVKTLEEVVTDDVKREMKWRYENPLGMKITVTSIEEE